MQQATLAAMNEERRAAARRTRRPATAARVVFNRLLGGFYVVRGPHQTPLSGRFESREAAIAWLDSGRAA